MLKHDSGKQEKTDDRVLCSVDRHRPVANHMNSSLTKVKDSTSVTHYQQTISHVN